MRMLKAFWRDTVAATSIEYALIFVFLSATVIAGASLVGTKLNAAFVPISANLN